jgi:hypothetical protein
VMQVRRITSCDEKESCISARKRFKHSVYKMFETL